jgi:zinc/manganese transport system permease protein
MPWLTDPFSVDFMLRALVGGGLVATICAVVGTWVVVRGMAFLGEAMGHGMLPGVALAGLIGVPAIGGAAVSAVVMSLGVSAISRRGRLSQDTSIGLLFVGMLSLGVIIVSHSRSFAVDLTAILFGDILAIGTTDIATLAVALAVTVAVAAFFHRSFVALSFDERVAATLRLRPRFARAVLTGLVTLAIVASYGAVGSLLVVGLLLGPAVAAAPWTERIPGTMLLAVVFGLAAVTVGLLVSWHAGTAAGASIAFSSVTLAALSAAVRRLTTQKAAIALP